MSSSTAPSALHAVHAAGGWTSEIDYRISLEPTRRQVRGTLAGVTVVDSVNAMLMLEQGLVPVYYFPRDDVKMELLTPTDQHSHCPHKGDATYWSVSCAGRSVDNGVWAYPTPQEHLAPLSDLVAFYWHAMDHWYEED